MKTTRTDTETDEPTTPRFNTDTLPASTEAESMPPAGGAARRFKISGLHVNQATADLPDEQRSLVRRLHAHCCEQDMTLPEIGEKLGYDATVLHKVLHGKYEGSLPKVCEAIARYFRLQDERDQGRKLAFIETDQTRRIWQFCRMALEVQRVGFIFGDTQIGKTEPLKAYAKAHNHGETIFCEVPTGGAMINFLGALARALRINPDTNERALRASIFAAVDDRMLIIVDEVHRAIPSATSVRPVRCIEFLRELHDHTRCGLILCATNVFREILDQKRGPVAGILKQMKRRRFGTLQLPDVPSDRDLAQFAKHYGLPAATGEALRMQTEVIRDEALGMWLLLLRMGAKLANKRKRALTWQLVAEAKAGLDSMANPELSTGSEA